MDMRTPMGPSDTFINLLFDEKDRCNAIVQVDFFAREDGRSGLVTVERQCTRPPGFGPGGLYCATHARGRR